LTFVVINFWTPGAYGTYSRV